MGLMSCIDTFMWHMKFLFLTKHKDVRSSNRSILRRSSYFIAMTVNTGHVLFLRYSRGDE